MSRSRPYQGRVGRLLRPTLAPIAVALSLAGTPVLPVRAANPTSSSAAAGARVRAIKAQEGEGGRTSIVISASERPTFTTWKLERPSRVVVEISGARLGDVDVPFDAGTFAVGSVAASTVTEEGGVRTRVVLTLRQAADYTVRATGSEIVLEVVPHEKPARVASGGAAAEDGEALRRVREAEAAAARAAESGKQLAADKAKAEQERARAEEQARKLAAEKAALEARSQKAEEARALAEAATQRAEAATAAARQAAEKAERLAAQKAKADEERARAEEAKARAEEASRRLAAEKAALEARKREAEETKLALEARKREVEEAKAAAQKAAQVAAELAAQKAKAEEDRARADAARAKAEQDARRLLAEKTALEARKREADEAKAAAQKATQVAAELAAQKAKAEEERARADVARAKAEEDARRLLAEKTVLEARRREAEQAKTAADALAQRLAEEKAREAAARREAEATATRVASDRERAQAAEARAEAERAERARRSAESAAAKLAEEKAELEARRRRAEEAQAAADAAAAKLAEEKAELEARRRRAEEARAAADAAARKLAQEHGRSSAAAAAEAKVLARKTAEEKTELEARRQRAEKAQAAADAAARKLAEEQAALEARRQRAEKAQLAADELAKRLAAEKAALEAERRRADEERRAAESARALAEEARAAAGRSEERARALLAEAVTEQKKAEERARSAGKSQADDARKAVDAARTETERARAAARAAADEVERLAREKRELEARVAEAAAAGKRADEAARSGASAQAEAARKQLELARAEMEKARAAAQLVSEERARIERERKEQEHQRRRLVEAGREVAEREAELEAAKRELAARERSVEEASLRQRSLASSAKATEAERAKAAKALADAEAARGSAERQRRDAELAAERSRGELERSRSELAAATEARKREEAKKIEAERLRREEEERLRIAQGQRAEVEKEVARLRTQLAAAKAAPKPVAPEAPSLPERAPTITRTPAMSTIAEAPTRGRSITLRVPARVQRIDFVDEPARSSVIIDLDEPANFTVERVSGRRLTLRLDHADLPRGLERSLDATEYLGPVRLISSYRDPSARGAVRVDVELAEEVPSRVRQDGARLYWDFQKLGPGSAAHDVTSVVRMPTRVAMYRTGFLPVFGPTTPTVAQAPTPTSNRAPAQKKRYTGRRIDLDFKGADIHNILRLLSDVGGVNIVTSDDVKGEVTIKMRDVPWDQALDVVLRAKSLGQVREGNLIRVAPLQVLEKELEQEIARQKQITDVLPTETRLIGVSYAEAKDIQDRAKDLLSPRGKISVDDRTNNIIVSDVAKNLSLVEELVKNLDTQTSQIVIEARIVEARSTFARAIGIQWGGTGFMDAAHGNPTGLVFPSNVGIGGAATDQNAPVSGLVPAPRNGVIGSQSPNFAVNLPAAVGTGSGGALGLTLGSVAGAFNLNLRLSALETTGQVRIVSAPRVSTLDNNEASISQGVAIPISVVSAQGVQTVFVDAKLNLTVKPHVTNEGTIILNVHVTRNEPDFVNTGARGDPTILKKEAKTMMLVRDGDTAVIGGIFQRNSGLNFSKVPFLADIPILGYFFKLRRENDDRTEFLVFITPRIANRGRSAMAQ